MLSFVAGTIEAKDSNILVINCNGVGFELNVSETTNFEVGNIGDFAKVHTYMAVREDAITLFGFATLEEKNTFLKLINVSGIGGKMAIAILSAMRSKDPSTSVGACIVSEDNKILSLGYNGMPIGCSDDEYPWEREGNALDTKYLYVCHAELNAILNYTGTALKGAKIYTTLFPCNECTKALIQSGIKEVIYLSDKYAETDSVIASKRMMTSTQIKFRKYEMMNKTVTLSL